jgi:cytochrome c oxidase assembly factor CtaG
MANWYPEWLALVPWVIGAALAAERLVHLTANRKAGRWLAFTFIGVATLICAVSGGAHLGILIVCEPSQSAAAE